MLCVALFAARVMTLDLLYRDMIGLACGRHLLELYSSFGGSMSVRYPFPFSLMVFGLRRMVIMSEQKGGWLQDAGYHDEMDLALVLVSSYFQPH